MLISFFFLFSFAILSLIIKTYTYTQYTVAKRSTHNMDDETMTYTIATNEYTANIWEGVRVSVWASCYKVIFIFGILQPLWENMNTTWTHLVLKWVFTVVSNVFCIIWEHHQEMKWEKMRWEGERESGRGKNWFRHTMMQSACKIPVHINA